LSDYFLAQNLHTSGQNKLFYPFFASDVKSLARHSENHSPEISESVLETVKICRMTSSSFYINFDRPVAHVSFLLNFDRPVAMFLFFSISLDTLRQLILACGACMWQARLNRGRSGHNFLAGHTVIPTPAGQRIILWK